MKYLPRLFVLLTLVSAFWSAPVVEAADVYAAVAYSPTTGRWGYGQGYPTRAQAISRALRECGSRDARTQWTKNAWVALAISDSSAGGWGAAWGTTANKARANARRECLKRNPDARVVVCVSAYN